MDKRLKEILQRKEEIRGLLKADDADLAAIETELDALATEENEIRSKINIAAKLGKPLEKPVNETRNTFETMEYRNAFMQYVATGKMPTEYRATLTSDSSAIIPTTVINKIVEKLETVGNILPLITRTAYKGGVSIPTATVKPVATWVAEGATSEKQKKTLGSIVFAYHKLRCAVAVSLEVDTMSLTAFEQTIINNISEAMAKALEQSIINGTGEGQPTGILTATIPAGQDVTVDKFTYKKLVEIESALPSAYEAGSVYVMSKKTFGEFLGMVDTAGQPIARVNYGIAGNAERSLLGRSVLLSDYVPAYSAVEAGKPFAFIFKLSDYVLNTNYQLLMRKYEDNETDDLITKAILLADGKVVDNNSLVVLRKPTA